MVIISTKKTGKQLLLNLFPITFYEKISNTALFVLTFGRRELSREGNKPTITLLAG